MRQDTFRFLRTQTIAREKVEQLPRGLLSYSPLFCERPAGDLWLKTSPAASALSSILSLQSDHFWFFGRRSLVRVLDEVLKVKVGSSMIIFGILFSLPNDY